MSAGNFNLGSNLDSLGNQIYPSIAHVTRFEKALFDEMIRCLRGAMMTVAANYTVTANDHIILVDATLNSITVTLPPANTNVDVEVIVKKIAGANSNTVTVMPVGLDLIEGVATLQLANKGATSTVRSDGVSNWWIA